jgi:5'-3' exonuclease
MACDWLLIDGPSMYFRAFYGVRNSPPAPNGQPVNAVRGLLERLARQLWQRRPRHLAVADDVAWRPDWRVDLISAYKSHRAEEPVPSGLIPQIPVIHSVLEAIGIDMIGVAEHEAEDVIATWARLAAGRIEILSGDRDLFALVEDPRVCVLYPEKRGLAVIDEAEVTRRYGIPGRRYADFAVLRGDPSDGLPGLKGVGNVAAAGMIRRFGDIDGILRERPLAESDRAYLERAKRVVAPVADLPIELPAGRRDAYPADAATLDALAAEYGLADSCQTLIRAVSRLAGTK